MRRAATGKTTVFICGLGFALTRSTDAQIGKCPAPPSGVGLWEAPMVLVRIVADSGEARSGLPAKCPDPNTCGLT